MPQVNDSKEINPNSAYALQTTDLNLHLVNFDLQNRPTLGSMNGSIAKTFNFSNVLSAQSTCLLS